MGSGLEIPESGLSLRHEEQSGPDSVKPAQIMRLNLVQSTLDELIQSLIDNQPARVRLGKHPSIHYAGKSQSFHAYPETHRSEIYHSSTDGSSDDRNLYFTGVLSHSLEVEKAKQDTAATDQALANLEESLNAFERGKESKKTHIIQHPDELRALRGAGAGSSARRAPKSKAELEKDRLLRTAANRSLTSSPTLGAPRSPIPVLTPTSAPSSQTKNNARLEALKTPFIHLLAVREVSTKFLSRQTRSTLEDCRILAQKYGTENRLNREKFNLKDKSYKDLDVWKFPYPNQEDRQQAIEMAIGAFDRMRISRSDKLWQMLLPKEERGKGKCLSRLLNLSNGPIKKAAPPRIPGDGAEDRDEASGNEVERSTSSSASKGLDGAMPRSNTAQKSRPEKEPVKRPVKGKTTTTATTNTNSTLTGRVTKKTGGKAPAKVESKFKSAEFVHSSDDEDSDMPDATPPSPPSAPAARPKEEKQAPPRKNPIQKNLPQKAQAPAKRPVVDTAAASKPPKADAPAPKLESSQAKTASKKPAARQSTSPQKPSPLGSSPPTNASEVNDRRRTDGQNQSSSSSSSSPLISQLSRNNNNRTAPPARVSKPAGQSNGVTKSTATANPLKRKAEPAGASAAPIRNTGNLDHKRRRAVSASSGGSTGSASPPMSFDIARQRLSERSQIFKRNYAKYKNLHKTLESQARPSQADMDKLVRQHEHLQKEKREIWDEDRRLREGIL